MPRSKKKFLLHKTTIDRTFFTAESKKEEEKKKRNTKERKKERGKNGGKDDRPDEKEATGYYAGMMFPESREKSVNAD